MYITGYTFTSRKINQQQLRQLRSPEVSPRKYSVGVYRQWNLKLLKSTTLKKRTDHTTHDEDEV